MRPTIIDELSNYWQPGTPKINKTKNLNKKIYIYFIKVSPFSHPPPHTCVGWGLGGTESFSPPPAGGDCLSPLPLWVRGYRGGRKAPPPPPPAPRGLGGGGGRRETSMDLSAECALFFFGVSARTIIRRLDKNVYFTFNGQNLRVKR
jgi:hypothetical protein